MKSIHTFVLAARTGEIRTAQYNNLEHIVIPVTMMVQGVVWAVNSPFPALVLAEEFSKFPDGWNGRPVVGGHPYKHGSPVSANSPEVLEENAFGFIFNTEVKGDRLCAEAWIDPVRASRPGSVGERTLERIKEGKEILEVSVGVFTEVEEKRGIFNGSQYEGIWRDYVPDHLAILAEGDIGACSVEMGCGAMRANTVHLVTSAGMQAMHSEAKIVKPESNEKKGIKERFAAFLKSFTAEVKIAEDASDREVANLLDAALRASEPGYLGIDDVNSAEGNVVYAVMPEDRFILKRRGFTVDGATVSLGDSSEEVVRRSTYEVVTAASAVVTEPKTAGCGCGGHKETAVIETAGENSDMDKTARIAALVASKKLGPAMTVKVLESLTDEQIAAIESAAATAVVETPVVTTPVATPVVQAVKPTTVDEYIATVPAGPMRDSLVEGMRVAAEKKTALISRLRASNRCSVEDYPDAELQAMQIPGLEKLAKLAGIELVSVTAPVDFSLGGARKPENDEEIPAAPSLIAAIQNRKAAK